VLNSRMRHGDADERNQMPDNTLRITLISLLVFMLATYAPSKLEGSQSLDVKDPILTAQMLEDAPFIKPKITLQHAVKLAEDSLKKSIDLKLYFLQEAKLSFSKTDVIEPYWHLKWVRWGVKQSANTPLEIAVSMEGKVSTIQSSKK
jgi:hypothetical protein